MNISVDLENYFKAMQENIKILECNITLMVLK